MYTVYEIIELFVILVQDVHFIKVFLLKLVLMKSFCVINYRLKIFFFIYQVIHNQNLIVYSIY